MITTRETKTRIRVGDFVIPNKKSIYWKEILKEEKYIGKTFKVKKVEPSSYIESSYIYWDEFSEWNCFEEDLILLNNEWDS